MNIKKKNILFILDHYNNDAIVGSFRCTYWVKRLVELGFDVRVLAVNFVPDDRVEPRGFLAVLKRVVGTDVVICSGPDFSHFNYVFLKVLFFWKTFILDYRDPYSLNPRFKKIRSRKIIQKVQEFLWNTMADFVFCVTKRQVNYVCYFEKSKKISIIENGYDERSIPHLENLDFRKDDNFFLHYAGKMYDFVDYQSFELCLKSNRRLELHFLGCKSGFLLKSEIGTTFYGKLPYSKVLQVLDRCHAGLILTSALTYQVYTKLYDYIGLKKPVLIIWENIDEITDDYLEISANYPLLYFCENDSTQISSAISRISEDYQRGKVSLIRDELDTSRYSRKFSLDLVLKALD